MAATSVPDAAGSIYVLHDKAWQCHFPCFECLCSRTCTLLSYVVIRSTSWPLPFFFN